MKKSEKSNIEISTENNNVHVNVSNSKYSDSYKTTIKKKKDTFIIKCIKKIKTNKKY